MQAMKHASEGIHSGFETRTDITRIPKQGHQWPHKKGLCPLATCKHFVEGDRQISVGLWMMKDPPWV